MKMFKNFCVLILLHVMSMSTHSMALEHVADWNVTLPLPNSGSAVQGIIDAIGGIDQFRGEVKNAMTEASSMRNGMAVSLIGFNAGTYAIVAKICFVDGICWAAKMYEKSGVPYDLPIQYGIWATTLVQQYCPIPQFKGCRQPHKLLYCFTEWIEGKNIRDKILGESPITAKIGTSITIPAKVVTSLAEFVYNLTTCPIPKNKSKASIIGRLIIVSKMKRDDLGFLRFEPRNNTVLEAMNATTWAKRQFVAYYLLPHNTSLKPYDGLDLILLLSWVRRKLSESDNQQFVLHYYDLRMPNILVDEENRMIA